MGVKIKEGKDCVYGDYHPKITEVREVEKISKYGNSEKFIDMALKAAEREVALCFEFSSKSIARNFTNTVRVHAKKHGVDVMVAMRNNKAYIDGRRA